MKRILTILLALFMAQTTFGQEAIKVEKNGKGDPIIYLPGFTTPGSIWDETIRNLDGDYTHYRISYAGFNGLAPIEMPWYSQVKEALISTIEKEKLKKITLIGHSMGGSLAMDLAAKLGDQVQSVILIESIPCMREVMMPGVPASSLAYDSPYNNQMLTMSATDFANMSKGMAMNMTDSPAGIDSLTQWAIDADRETYVYGYTDLLKLDQRDQLEEIDAAVLILGGTFPSRELVEPNYQSQYANLKNKQISFANDSKHFIMFDQPEWLYEQINTFLK